MTKMPSQKQVTFLHILDKNRGIGPGFDLLRLLLALSILASHCSGLSGHAGWLSSHLESALHLLFSSSEQAPHIATTQDASGAELLHRVSGPARPYVLSRVPMFFALSGFLVSGSAFRTRSLIPFLGLRVLRILPALFVEVTLSAVILGGLFTNFTLYDYYTSSGFLAYFLNIVGMIHFELPGVFTQNPQPVVNANLWTLPSEFHAYAITAVFIVSGLLFNRQIFTGIFLLATLPLLYANVFFGFGEGPLGLDGTTTVYYFFMGVLFFMWREKIIYSPTLFAISAIACYPLMLSSHTAFIYPALLTYITIFIGMSKLPQLSFLKTGDYSYGIYLYGYPITQALIAAVPVLRNDLSLLLAATTLCTFTFAYLSWHLVEKRVLFLKNYLSPRSAAISETMHPAELKNSNSALVPGQP
jgi:peptidoglycan/LPS O-acetylase OafA/YrhL